MRLEVCAGVWLLAVLGCGGGTAAMPQGTTAAGASAASAAVGTQPGQVPKGPAGMGVEGSAQGTSAGVGLAAGTGTSAGIAAMTGSDGGASGRVNADAAPTTATTLDTPATGTTTAATRTPAIATAASTTATTTTTTTASTSKEKGAQQHGSAVLDALAAASRARRVQARPSPPPQSKLSVVQGPDIPRGTLLAVLSAGVGHFLQHVQAEPVLVRGRFVGWRVLRLFEDTPGLSAGAIRPGDTVVRVNGQPIERPEQFKDVWDSLATVNQLILLVQRDGRRSEIRHRIVQ